MYAALKAERERREEERERYEAQVQAAWQHYSPYAYAPPQSYPGGGPR